MVKGLQGNDSTYLKVSACAKHFAVHSGPEPLRHEFNATASDHDLRDTYLPAFYRLIKEADVSGIMCAYNSFNGQPCCGSNLLLRKKFYFMIGNLRDMLLQIVGLLRIFCTGIKHIRILYLLHQMRYYMEQIWSAGISYRSLPAAVNAGLITEEQIDISLKKLLKIRFRLGMFDPFMQGALFKYTL